MGAVAAQETETNNTSDDLEELSDELNDTVADTFDHQEVIAFNDDTRIVAWEFSDGQAHVAIETDRRAGVVISDALAGIGDDGATQVPQTRQFLERDEVTTVSMDVTTFMGGNAVAVQVDGTTVRLATEMGDPDDNPLQYFGGEEGLFTGMGMSVLAAGSAAGFVVWREDTGVIQA